MIWAQLRTKKGGGKLHLVMEPGEEYQGKIIRRGYLSAPLCGRSVSAGYRMTCNLPLAHACRRCVRILHGVQYAAR